MLPAMVYPKIVERDFSQIEYYQQIEYRRECAMGIHAMPTPHVSGKDAEEVPSIDVPTEFPPEPLELKIEE